MKSWISSLGKSHMAIVNSIWAACNNEEYVPNKVHFVIDKKLDNDYICSIHEWVEKILKAYGVEEPILKNILIDENDFGEIEETFMKEISCLMKEGPVAVDMTPGRKYVAAISMSAGLHYNVDHIYYLYLKESKYKDRPFPLTPYPKQRLIDIKKEGICCNFASKEISQ